jgi:signal peptidase II
MKTIKRTAIILFILLSCVGCDQATKTIARHNLPKSEVISFLNDTFRLQYIENSGGFLGIGANIPEKIRYWVFTFIVGVSLSGLLVYLLMTKSLTKNQAIALSLVMGGGFGNLIDRICNQGRVVDFMNLGIGPLRTGVFNVADIAITFGVIWFLFISVKSGGKDLIAL